MSIVLNSKTYNFAGFDANGVSMYKDTSGGVPGGFGHLTCRVTNPATDKTDTKVQWRLTMPILATADSACSCEGTVLRVYRFEDGKVSIPAGSLAAERADFATRVKDLMATPQYQSSITSLTQPST